MEHAMELEAFLDVSIRAGFSFGIEKASIAVIKRILLGHEIERFGLRAHEEKAMPHGNLKKRWPTVRVLMQDRPRPRRGTQRMSRMPKAC